MRDRAVDKTLPEHDVAALVPERVRGYFRDCQIFAHPEVLKKVVISTPPALAPRRNYRIIFSQPELDGQVNISLGPGSGKIRIDTRGPINLDLRMWRQSTLSIGAGTTMNSARIVCDQSDVIIGRDGLWSDDILLQSNDQHGIVDLETMEVINGDRRRTVIGDHVWIGRRTTMMPDVEIGFGSILAAGAVLTSDMPEKTIFAGVPARQIRRNVTWSRQTHGFSEAETAAFGARFVPNTADTASPIHASAGDKPGVRAGDEQ